MNQIGLSVGILIVAVLGASVSWRACSIICSAPGIILIFTILLMPEAPRSFKNGTMAQACEFKMEMLISFLCMFFLQFSGINAVLSNMQIILDNANLTISSSLLGILANIVQLFATLISAALVDSLGNRICWTVSAIIQLMAFVLLCLQQKIGLSTPSFIAGLFLEQIGYGIVTGPITFAATVELFKAELRAPSMAIITAEDWLLAAIVCLIWHYL